MKKKILWVGEFTKLSSGYANYSRELLTRLHNTGKYEIAELSSYGTMSHPGVKDIPWKYYPAAPEENDPKEIKDLYKSKETNQFGEWRFDRTVLDFKPDVVIDIRDFWYTAYQYWSHLRPYYSWLIMPTADSIFQLKDWIDVYRSAEGVLTYTEWSKKLLDIESGNNIKTLGAAPHCVDPNVFYQAKDKAAHKESMGISGDSIIIGTVMRNQKRKLFPDIMYAFANALDNVPHSIAKRMYLYLHTSYPDKQFWHIPELLIETGLGTRVLVSYICRLCKKTSCMVFQDAKARCPHCNNTACIMPSVGYGHSTEELVKVFQLFDLYVQYSITEGFGIPAIEATACGVPLATVDYGAMADIADRVHGYKVDISRTFREFESHMLRVYPNNDSLTRIISKFVQLPEEYKAKLSKKTREDTLKYFDWDRVAKVWEDAIDNLPPAQKKWTDPPNVFQPALQIPDNISNENFVKWMFTEVYPDSNLQNSLHGLMLLRDLNFEATVSEKGLKPISKKEVLQSFLTKIQNRNLIEQVRCGIVKLNSEPWIEFANSRNIKCGQ